MKQKITLNDLKIGNLFLYTRSFDRFEKIGLIKSIESPMYFSVVTFYDFKTNLEDSVLISKPIHNEYFLFQITLEDLIIKNLISSTKQFLTHKYDYVRAWAQKYVN